MSKDEILARVENCVVVPVLTLKTADTAPQLAAALIEGGIDVVEITLRTTAALDAIKAIKDSGLDCVVGAGTVLTGQDVETCQSAGADFLVTPATPASLVHHLKYFSGLVIPGAATPTEALELAQSGFGTVKFFPAEAAGGAKLLKSIAAPLPHIKFMPTGGINADNVKSYLSLPNVTAVGGSWMVPQKLIDEENWSEITQLSRQVRNQLA